MGKRFFAVMGAALAFGLSAFAEPKVPFPSQPDGVPWPSMTWPEGELPDALAGEVETLMDDAMARGREDLMGETRSIVIIQGGELVAEAYADGFGPETKQVSWSMAKAFTHAFVGRAVALDLIETIDAPMPTPWPADDPRAAISWRSWLEMTDGLAYREIGVDNVLENDVSRMMYGPGRFDVIAYVTDLPLTHEPGRHWNYTTAGSHMIGWALGFVIGIDAGGTGQMSRSTANFITQEFFALTGMDAIVEFDAAGTYLGGSLVWASARDYAKFGLLYLRGGVWEDYALLPDGWAEWARTGAPDDDGNVFGAGFWLNPPVETASTPRHLSDFGPYDSFSAQGHEGQIIWMVPSRDLVIVRTGLMTNAPENWKALYNWCQTIAQAFPDLTVAQ